MGLNGSSYDYVIHAALIATFACSRASLITSFQPPLGVNNHSLCTGSGAIGLTSFPGHNFPLPVFDCLQYAKTEGKAWVVLSYPMSGRHAEVPNQGPSLQKGMEAQMYARENQYSS